MSYYITNYFENCAVLDEEQQEVEQAIKDRILNAASVEEMANIMSDELVKSLMDQIKM